MAMKTLPISYADILTSQHKMNFFDQFLYIYIFFPLCSLLQIAEELIQWVRYNYVSDSCREILYHLQNKISHVDYTVFSKYNARLIMTSYLFSLWLALYFTHWSCDMTLQGWLYVSLFCHWPKNLCVWLYWDAVTYYNCYVSLSHKFLNPCLLYKFFNMFFIFISWRRKIINNAFVIYISTSEINKI